MAQAVRELLATFKTHSAAAFSPQRPARSSAGLSRSRRNAARRAYRAAALEADVLAPWPKTALRRADPLPNLQGAILLSVPRRQPLENRVSVARAAGLRPIASTCACAWRRAIAGADAVLDCRGERAALTIFAEPLVQRNLRAASGRGALGGSVRAAFVEVRRSGIADVQRVAFAGDADRVEVIAELLHEDGYARLRFGSVKRTRRLGSSRTVSLRGHRRTRGLVGV